MIQVTSNLAEIAAGFERAQGTILTVISEGIAGLTDEAAGVLTSEVRGETPVVSGKLRNSTTPLIAVEGLQGTVDVIQPATSEPNEKGKGGDFPYVLSVVLGRRAIQMPQDSKGAEVLWGPGFGPSMRSGPGRANPYPERATDRALPQITTLADLFGTEMLTKVLAAI